MIHVIRSGDRATVLTRRGGFGFTVHRGRDRVSGAWRYAISFLILGYVPVQVVFGDWWLKVSR